MNLRIAILRAVSVPLQRVGVTRVPVVMAARYVTHSRSGARLKIKTGFRAAKIGSEYHR